MRFTELEQKVIKTFGSFMNYDTLEDNLSDNCTCVDAKDVAKLTGLDIKSVKGVLSSLEQKNLLVMEITNINHRTLMVTEQGIIEYFKMKENENMVKVIERATGTEFQAKAIEGGFEVYTLEGEKYKKLKESTFLRYFKTSKGSTSKEKAPKAEPEVEEKKQEKKASKPEEPKAEAPKKEKKSKPANEVKIELEGVSRENMIEKIKKMLNLSNNNPSEEEGLSAALMAQKLMAKYNIHEDEVTLEEVKDEIKSMTAALKHNSDFHSWRKPLGTLVAKNFRVKCYLDGKKDVVFRGYKDDVKIAVEVFKYLYALGNRLGSKQYHEILAETGSGKGVYNSFVVGFLHGAEEAFDEQCTALMVVTPKEVEEEYEKFSANFTESKTKITLSKGSVYESGKIEGKAAVKSRQLSDKKKK